MYIWYPLACRARRRARQDDLLVGAVLLLELRHLLVCGRLVAAGSAGSPHVEVRQDSSSELTNPPGHLWRDKWTALSRPLSSFVFEGLQDRLGIGMGEIPPGAVFPGGKVPKLPHPSASANCKVVVCRLVERMDLRVCESGPLRAVHLSRHKWPGGLVN